MFENFTKILFLNFGVSSSPDLSIKAYFLMVSSLKQVKTSVYLTNRLHVAVRLFSNRSQMTSKCRKNKEVAHEPQASVSLLFLPHFDVLCDLILV